MTDKIQQIPTARLKPYPGNPRKISDKAVDAVAGSVRTFGFRQPIIADRDLVVIAGHTRLQAALKLGLDKVPVIVADLTPEQANAYRLADNRVAEFSEWDLDKLDAELGELDPQLDLDFAAFDDLFPVVMTEDDEPDATEQTDSHSEEKEKEKEQAVSQTGEIYELGPHRLMCGDSTNAENWSLLLGSEKPHHCFTSPPYNAGKVKFSTFTSDAKRGALYAKGGYSDDLDSDSYCQFASGVLGSMLSLCSDFVFWNVNYNTNEKSGYIKQIIPYLDKLIEQCAWVKSSVINYRGTLRRGWEPIYIFSPQGKTTDFTESISNVWEISNRNCNIQGHNGCFPVELPRYALELFSKKDDIVLEPFGGSGSTLIACAMLNRKCRMMELSPHYCDVIRRRWTAFARKNNLPLGSGALD